MILDEYEYRDISFIKLGTWIIIIIISICIIAWAIACIAKIGKAANKLNTQLNKELDQVKITVERGKKVKQEKKGDALEILVDAKRKCTKKTELAEKILKCIKVGKQEDNKGAMLVQICRDTMKSIYCKEQTVFYYAEGGGKNTRYSKSNLCSKAKLEKEKAACRRFGVTKFEQAMEY